MAKILKMPQKIEQSKQIAVTLNIATESRKGRLCRLFRDRQFFFPSLTSFQKKTLINIVLININRKLLKILQITKPCK